jgi:hypothetical protein
MNKFMKAIHILMAITLGFAIGADAYEGKFDVWKFNCAMWFACAWMADVRADRLEKKLNDIYDGRNK